MTTTTPTYFPSIVGGYPGDKPLTQWQGSDRVRALSTRQAFYQNDTSAAMSGSSVWHDANWPLHLRHPRVWHARGWQSCPLQPWSPPRYRGLTTSPRGGTRHNIAAHAHLCARWRQNAATWLRPQGVLNETAPIVVVFLPHHRTGWWASPSSPDRPESGGNGHSAARQLRKGSQDGSPITTGTRSKAPSVGAAPLDPGGPAVPEIAIVSDANGHYQWPLRAGRYELTVVAEGYQRVSKKVAVRAGEVTTLDFVLSRERRTHALSPPIRES